MNKNQNLNNISLLAFAFVAIIVIVNLFTTNNYGRANNEVVNMLQENDYFFNYHQLKIVMEENTGDYVLVDLRSEHDFLAGHLPQAINIPFGKLLDKASLRTLEKLSDKTPVFYGANESTAQTARMLLLSKGWDVPLLVLGGNYESAVRFVLEDFDPSYANYKEEKARFDYRRYMGAGIKASQNQNRPATVIPEAKTETLGAQGGC